MRARKTLQCGCGEPATADEMELNVTLQRCGCGELEREIETDIELWEIDDSEMTDNLVAVEPAKTIGFKGECGELYEGTPEEVLGFVGSCGDPFEGEPEEGFVCGECESYYDDRDDAKECCR